MFVVTKAGILRWNNLFFLNLNKWFEDVYNCNRKKGLYVSVDCWNVHLSWQLGLSACTHFLLLLWQLLYSLVFWQWSLLRNIWSITRVSPPRAHAVKQKGHFLVSLPTLSNQHRERHKEAGPVCSGEESRTLLYTGNAGAGKATNSSAPSTAACTTK